MKRNLLGYLAAFMLMVTFMLPIILVDASAATVSQIAPGKGKAGMPVNILGNGFSSCGGISVTFGSVGVRATLHNDKVIQIHVPQVPPYVYDVNVFCNGAPIFAGTFTVIESK